MPSDVLPLPVIDVSTTDEAAAVVDLKQACTEHGFFMVRDQSIPESSMQKILQAARTFFDLPMEAKLAVVHNKHAKGYQPWRQQTLDYALQRTADTKETWAVMDDRLSFPEDGSPFLSPNQWPDPEQLPEFRQLVEQYVTQMKKVRDKVNRLLAQALGQEPDFFKPYFETPLDMLRLFHYHCNEGSAAAEGRFGAGAHTDWGHVTYLTADGPGLEIFYQGSWQPVPVIPGCFVCNICDLLQLWSGNSFKSTRHRVMAAPGTHRYSCAYFTVPAWDALVRPLLPSTAVTEDPTAAAAAAVSTPAATAQDAAAEAAAVTNPAGDLDDNVGVEGGGGCDGGGDAGSSNSSSSGFSVNSHGEMLLGRGGVKVLDYITAKYQWHFADAGGKAHQTAGEEAQQQGSEP